MTNKLNTTDLAQFVLEDSRIFKDEKCPFKGFLHYGDNPNILVIVGENSSGKSLVFKMMAQWAKKTLNLSPITISIRERTGSGSFESSSFRKIVMFGDESEQSTGATSVSAVLRGFKSANSNNESILMLDEPEIGLSSGYSSALGELIGRETLTSFNSPESYCKGVVIVTHDRNLVKGICSQLESTPSFLCMNKNLNLNEWLESSETRTIEDLINLKQISSTSRKAVNSILNSITS